MTSLNPSTPFDFPYSMTLIYTRIKIALQDLLSEYITDSFRGKIETTTTGTLVYIKFHRRKCCFISSFF
ncbi:unnamed protein product [Rhizophagus irregularis]|nr:unnamed protein product [Rhizophagus irregularis]